MIPGDYMRLVWLEDGIVVVGLGELEFVGGGRLELGVVEVAGVDSEFGRGELEFVEVE